MPHIQLIPSKAPNLPIGPVEYSQQYQDQFSNVLRLYFAQIDNDWAALLGSNGGQHIESPSGAFHQDGNSTLTADIGNGTTTPIPVVSTAGFLDAGGLIIGDEIISYTGKTSTTFTGITRGTYGTSSSAHVTGTAISEAQVITPPAVFTPIVLTTTDASNAIYIDTTYKSRVVFDIAGRYNIQFSAQMLNYTLSEDQVSMWFRLNGADIANSAGVVTVPSKHGGNPGATITSWNLVLDIEASQYIELMMYSASGNTVVATYPPSSSPVIPTSPSIILTATFVSALPT